MNETLTFYVGVNKKQIIFYLSVIIIIILATISILIYFYGLSSFDLLLIINFLCLGLLVLLFNFIIELKYIKLTKEQIIFKYSFYEKKKKWNDIREITNSNEKGFRIQFHNMDSIVSDWGDEINSIILKYYQRWSRNPIVN